jgi:hypothetical protein
MAGARVVFLLVDYKGELYSSERRPWAPMDLHRIERAFATRGVSVEVLPLHRAPAQIARLRSRVCLYQSSEDVGLHYRSFIEDVVLGLSIGGAFVVPRFEILRAHHNKVLQEILRRTLPIPSGPASHVYGTVQELEADLEQVPIPAVLKGATGAASTQVFLALNRRVLRRMARRVSRTWHPIDSSKELLKQVLRPYHRPRSHHRKKFVVQDLVTGLTGDFKVLVYGARHYVLRRQNRPGDFRASGSGRFSHPESPPTGVLEAATAIKDALNVPFVSLDLASSESGVQLLEWQGINFGNYTLERSRWHFVHEDGRYIRHDGTSELEDVMVEAVTRHCEAAGMWRPQS